MFPKRIKFLLLNLFSHQQYQFSTSKTSFGSFQSPRLNKKKDKINKEHESEDNDSNQREGETTKERNIRREKEQKLLKEFETYKKLKNDTINDIPPNLVIKNLYYPPTKTDVILLGVERRNNMHASFVQDCMVNLKPGIITTQIPPDMPFFIRTKIAYEEAWSKFIKGKFDYKFYVNPSPTSVYDLMLNSESIRQLMSGGILNSKNKFELGSLFVYTPNHISDKFEVDTFLTPLLYLYNNPHVECNLIVNDYPILKYRDNVNRLIKLDQLKEIYLTYREVIEQQGKETQYDPLLLNPELFIYPKTAFITESIRNICYSSRKVLSIVDRHSCDQIEDYWRNMSKTPQNLSIFLKDEFFSKNLKKQTLSNEKSDLEFTNEGIKTPDIDPNLEMYIEYVEKHVILDLMINPMIREYFIINKVFPFSGKEYIGYRSMIQQIFIMLEHFYFQNQKKLKDIEPHSFEERQVHATPNDFIKEDKQI